MLSLPPFAKCNLSLGELLVGGMGSQMELDHLHGTGCSAPEECIFHLVPLQ